MVRKVLDPERPSPDFFTALDFPFDPDALLLLEAVEVLASSVILLPGSFLRVGIFAIEVESLLVSVSPVKIAP